MSLFASPRRAGLALLAVGIAFLVIGASQRGRGSWGATFLAVGVVFLVLRPAALPPNTTLRSRGPPPVGPQPGGGHSGVAIVLRES